MDEPRPPTPTYLAYLPRMRSEDDFETEGRGPHPGHVGRRLYRNGPNPQFDPQGMYLSIFGDGMIHGFFLEPNKDGGAPIIATAGFARRDGRRRTKPDVRCSATWASRAILRSPTSPHGTANTHVVHHAGKLMALQEHGEPFELDPEGLESRRF